MTTTFAFNPFTSNFDLVTTGLAPSDITGGTPYTVAGFDSTGTLESIPGFGIDTVNGGLAISLNLAPASNPNQTDNINTFQTVITPSVNLTQYNFNGLQNYLRIMGPQDFATVTGLFNFLEYNEAGNVGQVNLQNNTLVLGDGTNVSTSNNIILDASTITVRNQHAANNIQLANKQINLDAGSTIGSVTGYGQNIAVNSSPTNTINALNLNTNSTVTLPGGYIGIFQNIQLADDTQYVVGNTFGLNVNSGNITNGSQAYSDTTQMQSGSTSNGHSTITAFPNFHAGSTTNGYTVINANPQIDGSLSTYQYIGSNMGGQLNNTLDGIQMYIAAPNLNSGAITSNNYNGFSDTANLQSGSGVNGYYGVTSSPQFHSGSSVTNYQGLTVNPTLNTNVSSVTLAQLSANGSGTMGNITGLSINLSGVASTGRKQGLSINDGFMNVNTPITTNSGGGVDAANMIIPQLEIVNGSPITGTTVFGLNGAMLIDAQDDFGPGALGPSAIAIAFVSAANVAAGKTVAGLSMAGAGTQVSGSGTITELIGFHAIGSVPAGGSPIVTNQYMFKGASAAPGIPVNSWGIHIAETTAENFLGRLAVNTASEKNTATKQFDVLGDSKLDGALQVTDLGSGAVISDASGNVSSVTGSNGDVLTIVAGVPAFAPATGGSTPANSTIYLDTASGHGSSGTAIRTFNVAHPTGTDLTYTSDAVNGDYITVNTTGRYSLMWVDRGSAGGSDLGFTINQSNLTLDPRSVPASELIFWGTTPSGGGSVTADAYLTSGDVIRFNDGANCNNSLSSSKQAIVTRIA